MRSKALEKSDELQARAAALRQQRQAATERCQLLASACPAAANSTCALYGWALAQT